MACRKPFSSSSGRLGLIVTLVRTRYHGIQYQMFAQWASNLDLNCWTDAAATTDGGKLFQSLTTLVEKALRRIRETALGLTRRHGCPLRSRPRVSALQKSSSGSRSRPPWRIWKTAIMLPR